MGTLTADYRDAIEHMPAGARLVIDHVAWDEYERLLEALADRSGVRVSFDAGRLEIMTPLPRHEAFARLIDALVRVCAQLEGRAVESFGSATWKSRQLAKGAEPDACFYLANADRVIGKDTIDLDVDPPPDLVVEIDITNESLPKLRIYAALSVREIWRFDGETMGFFVLVDGEYTEVSNSLAFPALSPTLLAETLVRSRSDGQTAALGVFQARWEAIRKPRTDDA